jgi:lia operon protein LiaF
MKRSWTQTIFALLIITAGILLLLENLNLLNLAPYNVWRLFFPGVLMAFGLKAVLDSLRRMRRRKRFNLGWYWGVTLLLLGGMLALGHLDVITFTPGMVWRLWPLLLVYIGLEAVTGGSRDHGDCHCDGDSCFHCDDETHSWNFGRHHFSVGQMKHGGPNWSAEPLELRNSIGDYHLDYTRAFIPEDNIPVRLNGWIGDVKILIPREVDFSVDARAVVGDIYIAGQSREGFSPGLRYQTPGYDEAVRKLTFTIDYRILDLRIDHV